MTDGTKASVWDAVWLPYGGAYSISGSASNEARFPGQWFQIESGLAYNWHRHYDATTGRYSQADPLGFADGPSLYAYALNSPQMFVDPDGRQIARPGTMPLPPIAIPGTPENENWTRWATGKIRDFGNMCRRAVGLGGGGGEPEPCRTISGKVVPVGTIAYRPLDTPSRPQHGIVGPHYNLYRANKNPNSGRCFWQPIGAVPVGELPRGAIPIEPFAN
ncbi:MAG: RHS repeat-associated core domain-containing protein [Flavobacteriaceae bacterium]